jgi:hypothetical protein
MAKHETVRIKCYSVTIEAVAEKGGQAITTAIGGLRNEGGRGHSQGPFKLYENGEAVAQRICVQKGDKSARNWQVSVDNIEDAEFPKFHAVRSFDIRETRKITFVISG